MFYLRILKEQVVLEKAENVLFMKPHEEKVIDACTVSTLKSTDEGVAFLVKTEGKTIYHAGDLHWWDWPGEPEEDNKMMERQYKEELESLKKKASIMHLLFLTQDRKSQKLLE